MKTFTPEQFKSAFGDDAVSQFENSVNIARTNQSKSKNIENNLSGYLKNFASIPKKVLEEDYAAWQKGKDAVTHGANLMATGDSPVQKAAGLLESGLGTVTPTVQAVFAPLTKTNEAIIPGEGFIPTVARGGLLGAELGAAASAPTAGAASPITIPLGAVSGAVVTAGMYGLNKIKEVPAVNEFLQQHPEAERIIEGAITLAGVAYGSSKTDVLNTPVSQIPGNIKANVGASVNAVTSPISNAVSSGVNTLTKKTNEVIDSTKTKLAEQRLDPQTKESAGRLSEKQGIGNTNVKNPLEKYDEFISQEKQFKGDIKKDPALSKVGERAGEAFDKVVQQRRAAGQEMENQLKVIGETPTDLTNAIPKFNQKLAEQGLNYDAKTKTFVPSKTSKVTASDQTLINSYNSELSSLGTNPSLAQLDAFISRITQDLDVYKNTNNVTGTTNGMRIIKSNLSDLRDSLVPTKNGVPTNPELASYYNARQTYAKLSSFLDDGVKFLGKKTASGDYAKDASLLKSSVQSLLNNGKKDWLLKLEELTGYPALDETVLALQAMKDSGNFRGASLLQLVNEGNIPTSAGGIKGQLVDWAVGKGKQAVLGSPEQQTRAFLQSLNPKEGSQLSKSTKNTTSANTTPKTTATKVDTMALPKEGSTEALIEQAGGWKPGTRKIFDTALLNADKEAVLRLLPMVPNDYKITFAQKIFDILSK